MLGQPEFGLCGDADAIATSMATLRLEPSRCTTTKLRRPCRRFSVHGVSFDCDFSRAGSDIESIKTEWPGDVPFVDKETVSEPSFACVLTPGSSNRAPLRIVTDLSCYHGHSALAEKRFGHPCPLPVILSVTRDSQGETPGPLNQLRALICNTDGSPHLQASHPLMTVRPPAFLFGMYTERIFRLDSALAVPSRTVSP